MSNVAEIPPPAKPGLYWAKWMIADPGTVDAEICVPVKKWEPVEVFENGLDPIAADYLKVFVLGVAQTQSICNFVWGARIRPPKEGAS